MLDNKYSKCYYKIIEQAKHSARNGYVEKHHVLPKSLGGDNSSLNVVALTFKEHFVCHRLLVKMTEGLERNKMTHALWRMSTDSRSPRKLTSAQYAKARELYVRMMKEKRAGKCVVPLGHQFSSERNAKVSAALTGKKRKPFTEEHKAKISIGQLGIKRKSKTESQKANSRTAALLRWSNTPKDLPPKKIRPRTAEHRANLSKALTGKIYKDRSEEQKKNSSEAAKLRWAKVRALKLLIL